MIDELQLLKTRRLAEVSKRTTELLEQGFTYNDTSFNYNTEWNIFYLGMCSCRELGCLAFPLVIETKTYNSYTINNDTEFVNFITAIYNFTMPIRASGMELQTLIYNAETIEDVNAIIDNR